MEDNGIVEHLLGVSVKWIFIWGMNMSLCPSISAFSCSLFMEITCILLQKIPFIVRGFEISTFPFCYCIFDNKKLVSVVWIPFDALGLDLCIEFVTSLPVVLSHGTWNDENNKAKDNNLENSMSKDVSPHDFIDN